MHVEVTNAVLSNPNIHQAVTKLLKSSKYPKIETVKKVADTLKNLEPLSIAVDKATAGIIKAYADLDDSGNVIQQGKPGSFKVSKERADEYLASMRKFMEGVSTLELPHGKFTLEEVSGLELTPEHYAAISFLFE